MRRLAYLMLFCALSTGPALSSTGTARQGDLATAPILSLQEKGSQFAQVGRCKDYAEVQSDMGQRSGTCTCAGT
jgi:hypothetical protein